MVFHQVGKCKGPELGQDSRDPCCSGCGGRGGQAGGKRGFDGKGQLAKVTHENRRHSSRGLLRLLFLLSFTLFNTTVSNVSLCIRPGRRLLFFKCAFPLGSTANKNCFCSVPRELATSYGQTHGWSWSCVREFLEGITAGGPTSIGARVTLDPGEPCEVLRGWRIDEARVCPENR